MLRSMSDPLNTDGGGLREFLRSRRARISPEQAGLPALPGRRRAPGLRRDEVAQHAGLSADLYGRLEGGRGRAVSEAVLEALARALRLDEVDRDKLFAMVRPTVHGRHRMRPQQVRPGLRRVLDTLTDVPALILGHRLDVLAANPVARAFYTDFGALPARDRNLVRFLFADPAARALHRDWPAAARSVVTDLHRYAAQYPHDPELVDLVGELSTVDQDFRRWWREPVAAPYRPGARAFRHPLVGDLVLVGETLSAGRETGQSLAMHTAEPGSPDEGALRLLATWSSGALVRPGQFTAAR
jgi:hypothetical protein